MSTTLLRSWIDSANRDDCSFPVNNLPFGVISPTEDARPRCATAIGDRALDLAALEKTGAFGSALPARTFCDSTLNRFIAAGPDAWRAVREILQEALSETATDDIRARLRPCLLPLAEVRNHLPFRIAEFTDFYAGYNHAVNAGTLFRGPENPLPPNWLHMPIGYNGRASTVVVSGTPIRRPLGQTMHPGEDSPRFGPSQRLDFELELGAVVGMGSAMGEPIDPATADERIFGYVLLNDWSARDIQRWEYQPLGPFQSKAFGTTISPWIVTRAALAPFARLPKAPLKPLLPYIEGVGTLYDLSLRVALRPAGTTDDVTICTTDYATHYYTAAQMLAHHSIGGCAMNVGDLLGTGTISGASKGAFGSLLELTMNGVEPLDLGRGIARTFLEDGDEVRLNGHAAGDGYRIGFGACSGTILPAVAWPLS